MWKLKKCPHCAHRLDKKDRAIHPLVHQLNLIEGIDTIASCSGHKNEQEAYVSFRCRDHVALEKVCKLLAPFFTFNEFPILEMKFRITIFLELNWRPKHEEMMFKLSIEMPSTEARERAINLIVKRMKENSLDR